MINDNRVVVADLSVVSSCISDISPTLNLLRRNRTQSTRSERSLRLSRGRGRPQSSRLVRPRSFCRPLVFVREFSADRRWIATFSGIRRRLVQHISPTTLDETSHCRHAAADQAAVNLDERPETCRCEVPCNVARFLEALDPG